MWGQRQQLDSFLFNAQAQHILLFNCLLKKKEKANEPEWKMRTASVIFAIQESFNKSDNGEDALQQQQHQRHFEV